jgi:thioredoxin
MLICAPTLYSVGSIKHISSAEEFHALAKKGKPVMAKFYAPWCGACKMMQPAFEAVAAAYGDKVIFVEVNGEDQSELMGAYSINAYPTLVMIDAQGKKADQQTGALSKDALEEHIEKLLASAPAKKAVAVKETKKTIAAKPVVVKEEVMDDADDFIIDEEDMMEPVAKPVMTKADDSKASKKECKPCKRSSCKRCSCKKDRKEKKQKTTSED